MSIKKIEAEIVAKPGSYGLILKSENQAEVEIGKLATLTLQKGYYLYFGSAMGPGGLQARVKHHYRRSDSLHWHMDYLRNVTELKQTWYHQGEIKLEHKWAKLINQLKVSKIPLEGFGSSDCKCLAHLFYLQQIPDFNRFKQQNQEIIADTENIKRLIF